MDSILSWIGGKSGSCKKIVELMPPHYCYVEAFAGACWTLFEKTPSKVEIINDVNGELINFWRTIQRHPNEFVERSKYEMHSRELYDEYYKDFWNGSHSKLSSLERAFRFFIMIKCSYGSKFGTGWGYSSQQNQAVSLFNQFEKVDQLAKRLKNCQIDNNDFEKVITANDKEDTLILTDPPYIGADPDSEYFKSMGANNLIGFGLNEHQRLYKTLMKLKGKFILTIDNNSWVRERYCEGKQGENGIFWIENEVFYSARDKNNREHVTELIITNYDTELVLKQKKIDADNEIQKKSMCGSKSLMDF